MLVWVGGRIKMINAAKAEALAAFLNHLYIYKRCLFLLLVVICLLSEEARDAISFLLSIP